jgi:hypothetical protein
MRLLLVILILLLGSCQKEKTPPDILNKGQMVDWMIDIYLAESRTNLLPFSRDSAYKLFYPYPDSLMRRKGIQDSVLKKSYRYYIEHPAQLESIYDAVIDSLSLREQRLRQRPDPSPSVKPV